MTALTYAPPTQLELPKPPARQTPRSSTQLVNCKRKLKEKSGTSRYGRLQALSYPGFKVLAEAYRLELVPLPTTSDGSDLDALAQLCATRRIRAIYAIPMLHNPFGAESSPGSPAHDSWPSPDSTDCSSSRMPRMRTWRNSGHPRWRRSRRSRRSTSLACPRTLRLVCASDSCPTNAIHRSLRTRHPRDDLEHAGADDRNRHGLAQRRHGRSPGDREASRRPA